MEHKIIHYDFSNGNPVLTHEEIIVIPEEVIQNEIKQKEEQLISIYEEIQKLKQNI